MDVLKCEGERKRLLKSISQKSESQTICGVISVGTDITQEDAKASEDKNEWRRVSGRLADKSDLQEKAARCGGIYLEKLKNGSQSLSGRY